MATVIDMPKLSDTMSVGTLVNWLKNEGDEIQNGDLIAEVETDKATMELESFEDGILLKQLVQVGDQVPIGGHVAVIGEKGEEVDVEALKGDNKQELKEVKEEAKEESKADESAPAKKQPEVKKTPVEDAPRDEGKSEATTGASTTEDGKRLKVSPLARKLAEKEGLDLSLVQGSGPGGRIVKADIEKAVKEGVSAPSPSAASSGNVAPVLSGNAIAETKKVPLSGMRQVIAQRLSESKTEIPHFYLETEVNAGPIMQLRKSLNASLGELAPEQGGIKFTVNDFILKAVVEALRRNPAVNSSWAGDAIQQHGEVNLGVAVAVDEGLVVPVIRDAHLKGMRQISADMKTLAGKAKDKKLKPDDMSGSTFTVSSLGMFGITGFYGIINLPNAAILSVGTIRKEPVVGPNDEIVVGQRMTVGASFDHRVVDGATGALFLKSLREVLENPAVMLV